MAMVRSPTTLVFAEANSCPVHDPFGNSATSGRPDDDAMRTSTDTDLTMKPFVLGTVPREWHEVSAMPLLNSRNDDGGASATWSWFPFVTAALVVLPPPLDRDDAPHCLRDSRNQERSHDQPDDEDPSGPASIACPSIQTTSHYRASGARASRAVIHSRRGVTPSLLRCGELIRCAGNRPGLDRFPDGSALRDRMREDRPPRGDMGMRTIAEMTLAAAVALTLAACGGGGGGGSTTATCSPSGASLSITAKNLRFDIDCLAAPAGKPFSITLDNQDPGAPHDLSIYSDPGMTQALFRGSIFDGVKTETYHVHPLRAGTYHFRCDVHPAMKGTFIVA